MRQKVSSCNEDRPAIGQSFPSWKNLQADPGPNRLIGIRDVTRFH